MARRGKDLFQALQRRHSGAPAEPERSDSLREWGTRVREFFSSFGSHAFNMTFFCCHFSSLVDHFFH